MGKVTSAAIIEQEGKKYLLKDLKEALKRPSEIDKKIIKARLDGLSFNELSENDQRVVVDKIMFSGSAICGCLPPQTEYFAKFIADEILSFISEFGYEQLTESEFLLALRINESATVIKNPLGEDLAHIVFSGSCMNVSFFSKILRNYKILRNNLDTRIKSIINGN